VILFYFSSCTKNALEDSYARLPDFNRKLVIIAFISPDQNSNRITISTTLQRFGVRTFADIKPLKLSLYEDLNEVKIDTICKTLNSTEFNYYINNFKFKEGRSYTIRVESESGLEAEATCIIPVKRNFDLKVDTTSRMIINEFGNHLLLRNAKISIKDFAGEKNYYRLLFYQETFKSGKGEMTTKLLSENPITPAWNPDDGDVMHNDNGFDGQRIVLRSIEFNPINVSLNSMDNEIDSSFLRVYLLSTDKPYYDFHLSFHNYTTGDDPFAEPTFIYSNIKGGVGIFASYIVDSLIFKLK
jgi:hypothetical protein